MDLTAAELAATPLFERIFDPDQLTLRADADPVHGPAPLEVRFRVQSLDDTWRPRYVWNFGDGSAVSAEHNPTHTYRRPGIYTATVRVTDQQNKVGAETIEIVVLEEGP
jgi:PKD repeat protein